MYLRRTCLLRCPVERLTSALTRPALFGHLASLMLVFDAVEPEDAKERWSPFHRQRRLNRLVMAGFAY